MDGNTPGLEERVLEVLERWDRRLEAATAAWDRLPGEEQRRREVALEAGGESDELVEGGADRRPGAAPPGRCARVLATD
jgi:hypothetical protein